MTKKSWIAAGVAAGVLAAGALGAAWWGAARGKLEDRTADAPRTVKVERTSLAAGLELRGSLAYGEAQELAGADGVVTKAPQAGATHKAGQVLLEIEGHPVFLIHGSVPLWRDLAVGLSGVDVDTLRAGLVELGYSAAEAAPATPYDAALAGAVDQLYADAGYPAPSSRPEAQDKRKEAEAELASARDGLAGAEQALREARKGPNDRELTDAKNAIAAAEEALAIAQRCGAKEREDNPPPGGRCDVAEARRAVDSARAGLADLTKAKDSGAEAAAVETARAAVAAAQTKAEAAGRSGVGPKDVLLIPTVEMRIDQVKAKVGQKAEGAVVTWTATTVFATADLTDAQQRLLVAGAEVAVTLPDGTKLKGVVGDVAAARQNPETSETIPARARIDVADQAALAKNGLSGVTITMVQDEAADTLVVPVTALLALAEGGYAVELVDGTLVGVEVGLIQDTLAQVTPTKGGLAEGDEVVLA